MVSVDEGISVEYSDKHRDDHERADGHRHFRHDEIHYPTSSKILHVLLSGTHDSVSLNLGVSMTRHSPSRLDIQTGGFDAERTVDPPPTNLKTTDDMFAPPL